MVLKAFAWLAIALLAGCGGTAKSMPTEREATGGSSHTAGGSSHDVGGSDGGSPSDGSPQGGDTIGGSRADGGASAGAGGKVVDFPGGAPNSPLACDAPYAGPTGGPRGDGPIEELATCANMPDPIVLARYKNYAARVPRGLYYEPTESITFWHEACANSPEETVAQGPTDGMGTFIGSFSSEWFYEAVYCFEGGVRRHERNLRCDYFDGVKLANPTPERLAFLASLLWWGNYSNDGGAAILGHIVTIGDATDIVDICSIRVSVADFGGCDDVHVVNTRHLLVADGTVKLGTPEVVRTLKGDCR